MGYNVKIIDKDKKNKLMFELYSKPLYEVKAEIHGACVKFFTDSKDFRDMWVENFFSMPENIRPHARVFSINDKGKMDVLYEPESKTVIIKNCNYYGWVKSIALALVAEFFEDFTSEHRRYSVHGSFVDLNGRGIGIIGPSGSGKTTLTYGLLLEDKYNFLTDDWFFVRMRKSGISVYSSEKNSYIRDDIAKVWRPLEEKLKGLKKDAQGRSIADLKWIFGSDRIVHKSNLSAVVLLARDKKLGFPIKKLNEKDAVKFLEKNNFCNPHQLIRSKEKKKMRKEFFEEIVSKVPVYLLNTVETPEQSLARIKELVK
ncbi:hypothetical protein JXB01_00855 [Candidatus Micrarchaeota archaeon]|nr:hypothetical protein [Candidatus Micrarchaeota archaeon]